MSKVKQNWVKTSPFGDYSMTKDRVNARNNRNVHIIRKARALSLVGRHAGSKPLGRLLKNIRTFEVVTQLHEEAKKAAA